MKNIKTYEEFERMTFKKFLERYYKNDVLSKMAYLDCSSKELTDLDGIEQFDNVICLWCYKNNITSLHPIENLTKLLSLDCWQNEITSLIPITNLVELTRLDCDDNKITSLRGVENLNKLELFYCSENKINWVDYIDKQGRTYYIKLPKSITGFHSDRFKIIEQYWEFMDKNQPVAVSRKFNF